MIPKQYSVLLKDNTGNLISNIENKITSLSWEWNRIGGCGACNMRIDEEWDAVLVSSFAEDYGVEVYLPTLNGTAELWYSGYIDKVKPNVTGTEETVDVLCLGYINQLKRVTIKDKTYLGIEISNAVKDIAEVYSTGITSVTSTAADYDDTGFSADRLYFNESAYDCIKKLANIAGKREYGVRADKSLFFKARDNTATRQYNITEDFVSFKPVRDYNPIITKIYLEGGENYTATFSVTNRITTRETIVSNSSVVTQSVGQQFARMWLKEHGRIRRSYTAKMVDQQERIESTVPLGMANVNIATGIRNKYDITANLYDGGTKYDGGTESYQIERINYMLTDTGVNVTINFGPLPPSMAEEMDRLEYELTNQRNI